MSPLVQAVIVVIIVGGAVAYAIRGAVRAARGKKPSCCQDGGATGPVLGCSSCHGCSGCGK